MPVKGSGVYVGEVMEAPLFVDIRTPFLINIFLIAPSSLYPISYRNLHFPSHYISRGTK